VCVCVCKCAHSCVSACVCTCENMCALMFPRVCKDDLRKHVLPTNSPVNQSVCVCVWVRALARV